MLFTSITPVLQLIFSKVFNMFFDHFGVGRSQIECNMKVKIEISICTGLMLNDHSNPYIESTTVLSDATGFISHTCSLYGSNYHRRGSIACRVTSKHTAGVLSERS